MKFILTFGVTFTVTFVGLKLVMGFEIEAALAFASGMLAGAVTGGGTLLMHLVPFLKQET